MTRVFHSKQKVVSSVFSARTPDSVLQTHGRVAVRSWPLRSLLHLHPMVQPCLEAMTLGELSRLVYRDSVQVKHSGRKRLQEELQSQTTKLEHSLPQYGLDALSILGPGHDLKVDPMSKLLVQYLLEVGWCLWRVAWWWWWWWWWFGFGWIWLRLGYIYHGFG